ncbi:glycosyltransferase [Caldisericum sp.]|uniref:glycosyltransferase n=1 Tax=Caldisericum sp. TaxID=2499687 RepID=UPI003D11B54D
MDKANKKVETIAFYLPSLEGGGAERVVVNLISKFAENDFVIHLLLASAKGPYIREIPSKVRIFNFKASHLLFSLPKLIQYLKAEKPDVLLSSLSHANIVAIVAKNISKDDAKLIIREDNTPSQERKNNHSLKVKLIPLLVKNYYPMADFVVAVSEGVKDDLVNFVKVPSEKVKVIYNPVISPELFEKAREPVDHPWFISKEHPVILGVGRLTKQKDFPTLLKAFALVRKEVDARLVILGEGKERQNLEKLAKELGISEYVWMPGFVDNPYKYMSKASVFVLSSIYEGLANVLIEALALGVPVVSTDCPSGPREVLEDGKYGKLVPVSDVEALKNAIIETLSSGNDLKDNCSLKEHLQRFTIDKVANEYIEICLKDEQNE